MCKRLPCKQPVLAFYCSRPLIYEGLHIGFQFHEGNSEFNSEERNSDFNSNSNDGNSNSIPIPPGLGKANSNSIPIPELDLELARKSNSGAELTPTLPAACVMSHKLAKARLQQPGSPVLPGTCIPHVLVFACIRRWRPASVG